MESLDSKLDRLSPEQQREVEDFVDFLLQRGGRTPVVLPLPVPDPVPAAVSPPALAVQEPGSESLLLRITDLIQKPDMPPAHPEADPATLLLQEIASEKEDIITSEYMDYGKFEPARSPVFSPATEAVQRVKIKLGGKKNRDPVNDLLEWID